MNREKINLVCLTIIFLLLPSYLVRFSIGIPTTLLEILIYLSFIWSLFHWRDWLKLKKIPPAYLVGFGLFLIGGLIGVSLSPDKSRALGQLKGFILDPLIFSGLIYIWTTPKKIPQLSSSLIFSATLISLWAIGQKIFHLTTLDGRVLGPWQFDPSASANFLSLFLTPVAVLAWIKSFLNQSQKKQRLNWLIAVLITLAIYLSGSRGGLLSLIVALGYFFILRSKTKFKPLLSAGFLLASILLIFSFGRPNLLASPHSGRVSSSNNIRWEIWRVTLREILPRHWIGGIGLGNFQTYFSQLTEKRVNFPEYISPRALTPHNLFLAVWLNGGSLMLIGFLIILGLIYRRIDRRYLTEQIFLLSFLIYGLVDTPFFKNDLSILLLAGIAWYLIKSTKYENQKI